MHTFQKMKPEKKYSLPVSVNVRNTGNFDCAETVQVYVKALCEDSLNPQLKGLCDKLVKGRERSR